MKKKTIIYTACIVFFAILAIGLYALKEYNRKSIDLKSTKSDYTLSAKELISEFSIADKASNAKYLSKSVAISGNIRTIDTTNIGSFTIVLWENNTNTSIRCSMDSTEKNHANQLKVGSTVTVKGIYTGFNSDDLGLGADIIFNKCILIKD
jgi:hypothetical protein